jgi:mono/diheme cytochrome c family protein
MKVSLGIAIAAVAGATLVGAQQASTGGQASAPAGNADNGRKLFARDGCHECHGLEAQGATATAPRLGPDPVSFSVFSTYVRRPTGEMPPYTEKVVPAQDLADIYAFVRSVPKPPDAKSLPLPK